MPDCHGKISHRNVHKYKLVQNRTNDFQGYVYMRYTCACGSSSNVCYYPIPLVYILRAFLSRLIGLLRVFIHVYGIIANSYIQYGKKFFLKKQIECNSIRVKSVGGD